MRTFPSPVSWGSSSRDRMSLLAASTSSSPPPSPHTAFQTRSASNESGIHSASSFDKQRKSTRRSNSFGAPPQKEPSGAIQFIPAYTDAMSPNASNSMDTTQPLSSPEHSFSMEQEPSHRRNRTSSGSLSPKQYRPVVTPSPFSSHQATARAPRRISHPRTAGSAASRIEDATASVPGSSNSTSNREGAPTRIGRLASLFSSRAIVKSMDGCEEPCPSPPRSDSSSGYVGWPGTQDKRGGTVALEQSSYSDSEIGAVRNSTASKSDSNASAPDYNLAAAVVNASAAAKSPLIKQQPLTEAEKIHRLSAPMRNQVESLDAIYGKTHEQPTVKHLTDPWSNMSDGNEETMSEVSTRCSKTSSAYFSPREDRALRPLEPRRVDRQAVVASVMRFQPGKPQPPTEEALRLKDHLTPPHRTYNATNATGYRGLLDKTRDVPNLMDDTESDSTHSSISGTNYSSANARKNNRTRRIPPDPEDQILEEVSSDIFEGVNGGGDGDSDVFDGLSNAGASRNDYLHQTPSIPENGQYQFNLGAIPRNDNENLNVVLLGGGLTTIQTTANDFSNRVTASDFDENLTNSDYDQYGFAKIPGFNEMATAGKKVHDRAIGGISTKLFASATTRPSSQTSSQISSRAQEAIRRYKSRAGSEVSSSSAYSDQYEVDSWSESARGSLMQYYVHPEEMKQLVKRFRKMSSRIAPHLSYDEMEREEDATKAFALMEMRSRIMEKDIERGLERRGGTAVVDDLVLTSYNRAAMRVRDAIIVAKAWRDGATPQDVINTSLLTRRPERSYYIPRPGNGRDSRGDDSRSPETFLQQQRYAWEEVCWVDDLELSQYRCHSIGPRHLRGFEMFTIGDCQSILLKLCNQQCVELREKLNEATAHQLQAEDEMKAEEAFGDAGMMTEAEMKYLSSMEEVKTVSHKLVLAEKAFTLVRDRIEKLVAKYEALLLKFDNDAESIAPSSVVTDASSYYSDCTATTFHEEKEREVLARRAQTAELRAELAAREAMLTKQRAREERREKEMEIQALRQKLNDLQSESSAAITEREHSVVLARAITASRCGAPPSNAKPSAPAISLSKIKDVKQRFRNRSASRSNMNHPPRPNPASSRGFKSAPTLRRNYQDNSNPRERGAMFRSVGEEMFQHLDFYERSLKAVEATG